MNLWTNLTNVTESFVGSIFVNAEKSRKWPLTQRSGDWKNCCQYIFCSKLQCNFVLMVNTSILQVNLGSSIYQVSRNMNQPQMSSNSLKATQSTSKWPHSDTEKCSHQCTIIISIIKSILMKLVKVVPITLTTGDVTNYKSCFNWILITFLFFR